MFISIGGLNGIDFSTPIVLYLFVVAIGTDYNILLSSRLREEFRNGYTTREAARLAVSNDYPTVAAAGLILAGTFASLMLTGIASLTELGFGVAVGIVIAAFAMAPQLIPAVSALQGRSFWWPSRSRSAPQAGPAGPDLRHACRAQGARRAGFEQPEEATTSKTTVSSEAGGWR